MDWVLTMVGKRTPVEIVVEKLIKTIEETGEIPWQRPFRDAELAYNPITGTVYSGGNAMCLRGVMMANPEFTHPAFVTYKGATQLGGSVVKGEHGFPIIYTTTYDNKKVLDSKGNPKRSWITRYYTVFNVSQCENLTFEPPATVVSEKQTSAEEFWALDFPRPEVVHSQMADTGGYQPRQDIVVMPPREHAVSDGAYWSTMFHEAVHWTGHEKRLTRPLTTHRMSKEYAREELVAEIGAAYLSGAYIHGEENLELNSAIYLDSWIKVLRETPRILFSAGSEADKAIKYLGGLEQ